MFNGVEFGDGCAQCLPDEIADVFFEPTSFREEDNDEGNDVTSPSSTEST